MYTEYIVSYNFVNTTYLVEANAKAAIDRLGEKATLSVRKSANPYAINPVGTPYLRLDTEGLVNVGEEIVDAIRNTRCYCYALPENAELAKESIQKHNAEKMKHQDRHYSQLWV